MRAKYRIDGVAVQPLGSRPASWTFARRPVSGTEYSYAVVDHNFRSRNEWEFVVRVPKDPAGRIEVRPLKAPNISAWAGLERRSLTFKRANRQHYRGSAYCPVALADPTGNKSRTLVSDKAGLPPWFEQLRERLRKKATVATTRGTDGESFVLYCSPDDHTFMIRAFFAAKVWVLRDARWVASLTAA
jgi:hypothetical protein